MMQTYVNGQHNKTISLLDRGLHYGDGVFETIKSVRGTIPLLSDHLQRLKTSCQRLAISMPAVNLLQQELDMAAQHYPVSVIKLILTRGIAETRGYAPNPNTETTRVIIVNEYSSLPFEEACQGLRAIVCQTRLSQNAQLAGLKHLNKLEYVLASAELAEQNSDEGILLDTSDRVIECTKSNIFFVKAGRLFTPSLNKSGVEGVLRNRVIALAKEQFSIQTELGVFDLPTLFEADEIFLCNSIIGVRPITMIEQNEFNVGDLTKRLIQSVYKIIS